MLPLPSLQERLTFKQKLILFSLLISHIPVLILGTAASYLASSRIQTEVSAKHELALRQLADQVDTVLKRLDYLSIQLAGDVTIEKSVRTGISMDQLDALEASLDMKDTIAKYRSYSDILLHINLVYHHFSKVFSSRLGLIPENEFPYGAFLFSQPAGTGARIIPANTYPSQKDLLIVRPIGPSGLDGTLVLEVDMSRLYQMLKRVSLGDGSRVLAVNGEGRIVLGETEQEIGTPLEHSLYRRVQASRSPLSDTLMLENRSFHLSSLRSAFNDWSYLVLTPSANLTAKSQQIRNLTWLITGSLSLLCVIMVLFASHRLYVPIQTLLQRLPKLPLSASSSLAELDRFMANMLETNNRLADELKEKLPLLKENLLLQLLRGEISERDFAQQSSRNQLKLDGPVFLLCLFEVDQFAHFQERYWGRDRSLMMYSMSKVIAELAGEKQECWTVTPKPGQVALILSLSSGEAAADEAEALCHQIRFHISLFLKFTVTAAITRPCYSRSRLHEAYQEGLDLLQYRMLLGGDITVQPEAVRQMPAIGQSTRMLIKRQKGIVKRIAEGRIDEASSEFEHFMQELPRVAPAAQSVIGIFTQLLAEVDHGLDELGLDLSELVSLKAYSRLMEAESLDAIKAWFEQEFFPALRSRYEKLSPSAAARLVQQVVEYIHNGAEQELSLQEAASRCGLSPSQLSRMFKEEKGCNFIDYVMECRMSKAKEWLAHTPMPIKEIAERLQYTNTQNFSRAFKQHTGHSPGQYREQAR